MATVTRTRSTVLAEKPFLAIVAVGERVPATVAVTLTRAVQPVITTPFTTLATESAYFAIVTAHTAHAVV